MKYKSALMTAASGSLRGIVASHNRGGTYFRGRTIPVNPNTAQQLAVRDAFSTLQTSFLTPITAAQRLGWQTYAVGTPITDALGDPITLTAQQMYLFCNVPRIQAGVASIAPGPTTMGLTSLTTPVPTITAAGTTVSVAFTAADAWANEVGGYLLVYASRTKNVTVNFFKGPFRLAGKISGAGSPPSSPAVITLPFASGPTTSRQWFRFLAVRADGRVSPEQIVQASVP